MSVKEERMSDADDDVYSTHTIKIEPMSPEREDLSYPQIKVEKDGEYDTDAVSTHGRELPEIEVKREELCEEEQLVERNSCDKVEIEIGPTVIQPQYIGSSLHTTDASKAELIQCGGADVTLDTTTPGLALYGGHFTGSRSVVHESTSDRMEDKRKLKRSNLEGKPLARNNKSAKGTNPSSQESTSSKRSRVPNFTVDEKILLTQLVNRRRNIIENKNIDGKSVSRKKEAWLLIAREFNSVPNVLKRDHIILRRAWDNLKATTRKGRASDRGHLINTDGAPLPPQLQHIPNMVEEPAPTLQCEINNDPHDAAVRDNVTSENKCDETIANPLPQSRRTSDSVSREAARRLKNLEVKKKYEIETLRAKLKIAQLKHQLILNELEEAKLEVASLKNYKHAF